MIKKSWESPKSPQNAYQQLKELSPVADDEVAGAGRGGGVDGEGGAVREGDEGRLVPVTHEEFPHLPVWPPRSKFVKLG